MKTCSACKRSRPTTDFWKDARRADGLQNYCVPCAKSRYDAWRRDNLPKMAADQKRRRAADPQRFADYDRKRLYGLPPGEYDRMLAGQGGRCAICETTEPGGRGVFHVDHCHGTGSVRGLLCHGCNVSLGHFKHSEEVLKSAIRYLAEGRGVGGDALDARKEILI